MESFSKFGLYLTLAFFGVVLLSSVASAEDSETSKGPVSCQNATAATVNSTLLLGEWFEVARKEEQNNKQCLKLDFQNNTSNVIAHVTYSVDPKKLWINQTDNYTINFKVEPNKVEGIYNETLNGTRTIYKILATDYDNFAFVCGYNLRNNDTTTNTETTTSSSATNESSSTNEVHQNITVAYVLVRQRYLNSTATTSLLNKASSNFSDFNNLKTVIQSSKCTNGASTLMPMFALLISIVFSILKLSP